MRKIFIVILLFLIGCTNYLTIVKQVDTKVKNIEDSTVLWVKTTHIDCLVPALSTHKFSDYLDCMKKPSLLASLVDKQISTVRTTEKTYVEKAIAVLNKSASKQELSKLDLQLRTDLYNLEQVYKEVK